MAYAEVSDIQARFSHIDFTASTKPTMAQVESFLDLAAGQIDVVLRRRGYKLPIAEADHPTEYEFLKRVNIEGTYEQVFDPLTEAMGAATPNTRPTKRTVPQTTFERMLAQIDRPNAFPDLPKDTPRTPCIRRGLYHAWEPCDEDEDDAEANGGSSGGGGGTPTPTTAQVGVAWSTDDTIDDAEIAALVTSTSRMVMIPALPAGETSARLVLWTADASGTIMGVTITMQFGDQHNLFDNANAEARTVEMQAGTARIMVNPVGVAYAGQMLTVTF